MLQILKSQKSTIALCLTVALLAGCSGDDGDQGPAGAQGANGSDGTNGTNGLNSLISQTQVAAGDANCINGGVQIDSGLDSNSNGVLDAGEVTDTQFVCAASEMSSYEVTVTNLTNAQPLSPVAVVLHSEGQLWSIGSSSSEALEYLAEGGNNSFVLGLPVATVGASGQGPIGPGSSETITITIEENDSALLSVVTMLVNTNDAFTGVNAQSLAALEVGDSWSTYSYVYDSGTEANSEAAGTIPGPADGGAGFDAARDDVDYVSMHPGVVSAQDGLTTSVLTKQHGFDNPAAKITVTRTE